MDLVTERDPANKRTVSMWEECGIAFRSNIVEVGGKIPLHVHSNPHMASVHGRFRVKLIDAHDSVIIRNANNIERIDAGVKHEFEFLGTSGVGEVLCFCPADRGF